jgi:hypothetical protein
VALHLLALGAITVAAWYGLLELAFRIGGAIVRHHRPRGVSLAWAGFEED